MSLFLSSSSYIYKISAVAPAVTSMGMDTLEEEEDKARFFAQLEAGALTTIDYSQLNKELDSTTSTMANMLRYRIDALILSNPPL